MDVNSCNIMKRINKDIEAHHCSRATTDTMSTLLPYSNYYSKSREQILKYFVIMSAGMYACICFMHMCLLSVAFVDTTSLSIIETG